MAEADKSDQKSGEVPVARTAEAYKKDEPREAMGQVDDA